MPKHIWNDILSFSQCSSDIIKMVSSRLDKWSNTEVGNDQELGKTLKRIWPIWHNDEFSV